MAGSFHFTTKSCLFWQLFPLAWKTLFHYLVLLMMHIHYHLLVFWKVHIQSVELFLFSMKKPSCINQYSIISPTVQYQWHNFCSVQTEELLIMCIMRYRNHCWNKLSNAFLLPNTLPNPPPTHPNNNLHHLHELLNVDWSWEPIWLLIPLQYEAM